MPESLKAKLTYANVMATVAVVIALGGASAFAASQLGKNTVGTKQLKKDAVTTAKIKNQAIKSAKLADGAVTAAKLAPGVAISGPPGPPGAGATASGSTTTSFSFRTSADETVDNLVQAGGLSIDVSCIGTVLTATARTSVDNSSIFTASINAASGTVENTENDSNFDTGVPRDLLGENADLQVGHTSYAAGANGPVVDVQWSSDVATGNFDCLFVGQVTVG